MSYSLFVGDLPYDCGDDKLYQTFYEKFKSVQKVSIIRNEDGSSRGFGYVRFGNEMEMKMALNQDIRIDNILLRTDVAQQNELKELLRTRLIECGWRDHISRLSRGIIQKYGVDNVRLEQIIDEITPKARSAVPSAVKEELLERIRNELKNSN